MKYLVVEKGYGEGCDYTIGCNMTYKIVHIDDSMSVEEAKRKIIEDVMYQDEDPSYYENTEIGEITERATSELIICPADKMMDLTDDLRHARDNHNMNVLNRNQDAKEQAERAEYDRLKKKYK